MPLRLIISDLDGTIVETEDYHRRAYNVLFKEIGLQVSWSKQDYIDRLKVMGGEKLREVFAWLKPPQEEYLNFKKRDVFQEDSVVCAINFRGLEFWSSGFAAGNKALIRRSN